MRGIVCSMWAYSSDEPSHAWPLDEQTLIEWSEGDVTERLFRDPRDRDLVPAMIYVRPIAAVKSTQPVLISNPLCTGNKTCFVVYADTHVEKTKDLSLWNTAKRLALLPKAKAEGIGPEDWNIRTMPP